ncbi:MAG: NADH-quinone oxidoreductase subunit C [Fidelibacterota bacterium]
MQELKQQLTSIFTDIVICIPSEDRMLIEIQKEGVLSLLSYLKKRGYNHLAMISCNDWIDADEFELIYIVSPYLHRNPVESEINQKANILIKTRISRKTAKFITIIDLFESAEPYEREIHEMFGIRFEGHPRLKPLMLERDYAIPPFRKDFNLDNYVQNTFGKIPSIEARKKGDNERT